MRYADPKVKPQPHAPDFAAIPAELQELKQWVLWRFDWNADQKVWAKVPYNPWTLNKARSDDPTTWGAFLNAVSAYKRNQQDFAGIGFMFSAQDEYCGIDFDNCVDADGELSPIASHWMSRLNSYTEVSPSGTGIHTIVLGRVSGGRKDSKTGIEIYDSLRYFAFTGRSWHENPLSIVDAQDAVNLLLSEVFTPKVEVTRAEPTPVNLTTQELLEVAFRAKNGDKIRRLFNGDISGHRDDDSSADLALCNLLAFYSGGDSAVLDEMFRSSSLMRKKWDARHSADGKTYGQMTVDEALAGCTEFYGSKAGTAVVEPEVDVLSDSIRTVDDYTDELEELYNTGYVPGVNPGWDVLNSLYTVKPGQWTVVTGSPGSGKSVWLNALLVNLAGLHGWRFAICSPEFWPISTHIAELMSLYAGQSFVPSKARMDKQTAHESLSWVRDHFTFIEPVQHSLTMDYALGVAHAIHDKQPINGLVLDPWTEFEQDRHNGETETDFTKRQLTNFTRFVRLNMLHGWIVAHPKMLRRDSSGQFPIPTPYDISGISHWFNKPHICTSLHRPDPLSSRVQVHIQKMKFRWCGRLGVVELHYDLATGRYSEQSEYGKHVQPEPETTSF